MYKINKNRLIGTFIDMVKIPSPSWKEEELLNYIIKKLGKINVTYNKYKCKDSFNLLVKMDGDKKRKGVLFSAHMDTVIPCENVNPVITETKISSDGTTILGSDDKSAIAIFLEGLYYINENEISHGPIEILFSCAEEIGLYGANGFDMSVLKSKYAFVFDSDGKIGKIILKAPYHSTMDIRIKGKAAHAGMEPEKGINAINVLSEIITLLPSGRIDAETTMNIGTVSGGRATNIVADEAECRLEVRSIDLKKLKKYEAIIRETVKSIASQYRAKSRISRNLEYSGFSIEKNDPISIIAKNALDRIRIKPEFTISGGGSDTNILNKAGIKALNLSSGMRRVHTNKEYIFIKDLINGTKLMLSIIDLM